MEAARQYDFVAGLGAHAVDWELTQAELLERARDLAASSGWDMELFPWIEGLWCFNPHCTNLSGPSELSVQTFECGGGCGVRYCSPECQERCWTEGHKESCRRLAAKRWTRSQNFLSQVPFPL